MPKEYSFTRLVWGYAISHTWKAFRSKVWDAFYVLISSIIGVPLFIWMFGVPEATKEALGLIGFAFVPLGIFFICGFVWNLWLAPSALAYDAVNNRLQLLSSPSSAPVEIRPNPPDFTLWNKRNSYSIREFAALLDGIDPAAGMNTNRAQGLERLLIEEASGGRLDYARRYKTVSTNVFDGTTKKIEVSPDVTTQIARKAAIDWALAKNIDVSKLI